MKVIFLNGRFLSHRVTGVQRFALEIVKALDRLLDLSDTDPLPSHVILLIPKNAKYKPSLKHITIKQVGFLTGHLWEQIELPLFSKNGVLLNLCNAAPLLKKKQIVTIHDAAVFAFPQNYSFLYRTWHSFLLKRLSLKAKLCTVSKFSRDELGAFCPVEKEKVSVLYEGHEHILSTPPDETVFQKFNLGNELFILVVGSTTLIKNLSSIIQSAEWLEHRRINIVAVGDRASEIYKKSGLESNQIRYIGYVSDSELRSLYSKAVCLLFPSFYEGFGLPPLEAMACGCPVIASDRASLPEICGDAVLYCDPDKPKEIIETIEKLLTDPTLRERLSKKGPERAKSFTWQASAKRIWEELWTL
ncbi:MAG: glycosyltransferase family 4 protein [Deltaproteobacteria bacterium]|nr:glycosyltransferase family 4 protein [Deltaproteobacteria bacterium]